MSNNYTLGRGEVYFARFVTGTETPEGERYLGNTPEFNLTIEEEALDHFSSDRGIREKDDSVSLETTRTGSLITDNIDPENVALFFFGTKSTVTLTATTVTDEVVAGVIPGLYYQLGMSQANPTGYRGLDIHTAPSTKVIVTDNAGTTTYTEGTDYTIDLTLGRLYIVPGGTIVSGSNIKVDYKVKAQSASRVISGSQAVEGSLRYIAVNPKGDNIDYFMPKVKIGPNGDYALKGEEWQQIPFNIEVLKKTGYEAIYADGRPVFA